MCTNECFSYCVIVCGCLFGLVGADDLLCMVDDATAHTSSFS